ncbi:hypothetical protein [Ciceribacter sp. RN22]|uniref:hypothetical protein n=1 Tax=Ciceribacter sp. RN22 TaxID=2954932 RepID=UPI002092373A|nr:hypothetical protein [Ciceribacter sp. RN22]MCO6178126.1 hypothetical protein [Ciceribacter sp. RN22]
MRTRLLCQSFNLLLHRLHVELREEGRVVSVELDIHDDLTREMVDLFAPDVIVAPFLKRAIPADVSSRVLCLAVYPGIEARLAVDEEKKPLSAYRTEELARMRRNFYGFDRSYHVARFNFIHKIAKSRTPATLAVHRAGNGDRQGDAGCRP